MNALMDRVRQGLSSAGGQKQRGPPKKIKREKFFDQSKGTFTMANKYTISISTTNEHAPGPSIPDHEYILPIMMLKDDPQYAANVAYGINEITESKLAHSDPIRLNYYFDQLRMSLRTCMMTDRPTLKLLNETRQKELNQALAYIRNVCYTVKVYQKLFVPELYEWDHVLRVTTMEEMAETVREHERLAELSDQNPEEPHIPYKTVGDGKWFELKHLLRELQISLTGLRDSLLNELKKIPNLVLRAKYTIVITTIYPQEPTGHTFFRMEKYCHDRNRAYDEYESTLIEHNKRVRQLLLWRQQYYTILPRTPLVRFHFMQGVQLQKSPGPKVSNWWNKDILQVLQHFSPEFTDPVDEEKLRNQLLILIELVGKMYHYNRMRKHMPTLATDIAPMDSDFVLPVPSRLTYGPVNNLQVLTFPNVVLGSADEYFLILFNFCVLFDQLPYREKDEMRYGGYGDSRGPTVHGGGGGGNRR